MGVPDRERTDWPVPWQPVWGESGGLGRWVEYLALRGALGLAGRLPERWSEHLIAGLARIARRVDRRHADAARTFLVQALGPLDEQQLERRVLGAYRHLFRVVLDSQRFEQRVPWERTPEHFEVEWSDEARRVRDGEAGSVIVTAHLGNWEVMVALAPWVGFDPLYAVAKPPRNRPLSKALQRSRERRGIRLLPRRGAMRDAGRIVAAGGSLGMLLDQRALQKPLLAPFFGRPARCDRSVGVLLRRLKVPVVIAFCTYTDRPQVYRMEFPEVLWPEELAGADPEAISTRLNAAFERAILAHPDQYFWLHDRYRDTPGQAPPAELSSSPAEPSGSTQE